MKNYQGIVVGSILLLIMVTALRFNEFSSVFYRQMGAISLIQALSADSLWMEQYSLRSYKSFNRQKLANSKSFYVKAADERGDYYLGILALVDSGNNPPLEVVWQDTGNSVLTRFFIGEGFLLNGDLNRALTEWGQISAQNQMINLARLLNEQGSEKESREAFQASLSLDDLSIRNQGIAHRSLARSYYDEGNLPAAAAHYKEVINLFPNDSHAYGLLGDTFRRQGDYSLAIQYFDASLRLGFHQPSWVWTNKGRTYAALGKWDAAVAAYNQALETSPLNETVLPLLVIANCKSGQEIEARSHFNQLVEISDAGLQKTVDELGTKFATCLGESS